VTGCVEGFRLAYPDARIAYSPPPSALPVDGSPDLVAQMLDKLVANAVEFAAGRPIDVRLEADGDNALISVGNEGPPLPEGMEGRLFESMVSVRPDGARDAPHLGLGLFIVRGIAQFHRGSVAATNKPDGVIVTVTLPRALAQ
jgi:signal transduction histidine kinase